MASGFDLTNEQIRICLTVLQKVRDELSVVKVTESSRELAVVESLETQALILQCRDIISDAGLWICQFRVNVGISNTLQDRKDEADYPKKKNKTKIINMLLRNFDAAIEHPETKEPSLLLAVNSYDGAGRYTLQSRITKKRSGSYKSLVDLWPLVLVKDEPRKEGVIERRKKKPNG